MLSKLTKIEALLGETPAGPTYADERDRRWALQGTEPVVCQPQDLQPRQYVVYRFGLFLQEMLVQKRKHTRVPVLIARTLPVHAPYIGNAFCNSIYFDAASSSLVVRLERLDTVGEYAVVLAHALAHVHVGSMLSDADATFLHEFHRCLHVLCEDIFSLRIPSSTDSLAGALSAMRTVQDRDAAIASSANFTV